MPRIKLWTDTHPNEVFAHQVGDSLREAPIPNVDTDIANPEALRLGRRFVDINLMGAYPGDKNSTIYEKRRAAEIVEESKGFDAVIDLHNVSQFGDTTGFIDKVRGLTPQILSFLGAVGVESIVMSDEIGMFPYVTNSFSLEMGPRFDTGLLRNALNSFANNSPPLEPYRIDQFKWFDFVDGLHVEEHLHPQSLDPERVDGLKPLEEFPELSAIIGQKACLMAWSREPNAGGYWGEIVTPAAIPDPSQWPGF